MIIRKVFQPLLVIMCALIAMMMALAAQNTRSAVRPNFTGKWRLNRQLSDDPQKQMKKVINKKGGLMGRMMGGKRSEQMENSPFMAESLTLIHHDPEFQKVANHGTPKTFYTDGRPVRETIQRRGQEINTETITRWQGNQLVAVTEVANGGKRTLTYALAEGGKQLIVVAHIVNPRLDQPISIRLVYDAEGEP